MKYPTHIMTEGELDVLYKISNLKGKDKTNDKLVSKISKILVPGNGLIGGKMDYREFMDKLADKHKIDLPLGKPIQEVEEFLFVNMFKANYEKLSIEEKEKWKQDLEDKGLSKDQFSSIMALTSIGLAQASGFGVYLLASSVVGAVSSAVGITLPFALYTAMSSTIKVATGPVGVFLAAIPLLYSYKDVRSTTDILLRTAEHIDSIMTGGKILLYGNYDKAQTMFNYWAGLRIMKINQAEFDLNEIQKNTEERLIKKKQFQEERLGFDEKIQEFEQKIEAKEVEIERLKNQINEIEIQTRTIKNDKSLVLKKQQNIDEIINAVEVELNKESNKRKSLEQTLKKLKD